MWKSPWTYKEGLIIGAGLVIVGLLLQLLLGDISWSLFAFPINIIALALTMSTVGALVLLAKRYYIAKYIISGKSAVASLLYVSILTIIMGFGNDLLSYWPFVLVYLWMTIIVGAVALKQISSIKSIHSFKGRWGALFSHIGLFVALTCGTLGNADIQKLRMVIQKDATEQSAFDMANRVKKLDFSVKLHKFAIDMYPSKLTVVNNATGESLPAGNPDVLLLEEGVKEGIIDGWHIKVTNYYDYSARVGNGSSLRYVKNSSTGSCSAAEVVASKDGLQRKGWISCGSYMYPGHALSLTPELSLVMPEREPKRYSSDITLTASDGEVVRDTILVNKPVSFKGWKVYQLSYDESKGEWSTASVLELVRDPWLPYVYIGIYMMLLGALLLFFRL